MYIFLSNQSFICVNVQKYRIFLRRVSDASYKIQYSADKGLSRNFRSSSELSSETSPPSTLMLNRFSKLHYQNPGSVGAHHVAPLSNLEASSSSLITQSGFGQSRLLSNRGSWLKQNIGTPNLMIHQNDRSYVRLAQNNYQTRTSIHGHLANISLEDASFSGSTRINPNTSYDASSQNNIGTSDTLSSSPSKNFSYQTNYVGYSIANIKHLTESRQSEKYDEGLNSCGGLINLPSDELQSNSTVHAATVPKDNSNLDQLAQHVGPSNSFQADNNGGEHLSDVVAADYRMLLPSNLPLVSGVENGGEIHESAFSPIFDLSEFDILSTQQPLEEGDFETTLADQVNIQNQAQVLSLASVSLLISENTRTKFITLYGSRIS